MNSKEIKEKMNHFDNRWNIISDSYEEAFKKFKQRILNIFKDIDEIVEKEHILDFCQLQNIEIKWKKRKIDLFGEEIERGKYSTNIIDCLGNAKSKKELYKSIHTIFLLDFSDYHKQKKYAKVKEAIEISDVNVAIGQSESGIILYPKAEKNLDKELVNKTLSFLNKESNKHFEDALKFYQNKIPVKSAESLRRSLEEFLRHKLKNQKGLKQNIQVLQGKLKEQESQPEIRNIISQIFNYLDNFFNEHSKHGDNVDEPENEFLIYQTGLLLRYINKVISQEKNLMK